MRNSSAKAQNDEIEVVPSGEFGLGDTEQQAKRPDDRQTESSGVATPDLNQSLARLEMNSLEVKLYLDSIDQRISRMEPRLEEMRVGEPAAAAAESAEPRNAEPRSAEAMSAEAKAEERVPAEAPPPPGYSTTERRRRAQGVPVERRRPPHAFVAEPEEMPRWEWKPWLAARIARLPALRTNRGWLPLALLALIMIAGVGFWGSMRHTRPRSQPVAVNAGPALAGSIPNGKPKSSADVPLSGAGPGASGTVARPQGDGRADRVGTTSVEQGVAVPMTTGQVAMYPGRDPAGTAPRDVAGTGGSASAGANASGTVPGATGSGAASAAVGTGAVGAGSSGAGAAGNVPEVDGSTVGDAAPAKGSSGRTGRTVPSPSNRVNVSSGVMAGNLIYSQQPAYPKGFAGLFHTEGKVVMQAIVSKNGHVENLRVISGHYMLRGAAKDAVRTWRYRPYYIHGGAVEVATIVSVEFHR